MKKIILITTLFFLTLKLNGQVNFESHNINTTLWAPQIVIVADMDGDGDNDVVCGAEGDERIEWYENLGTGTFGATHFVGDGFSGLYEIIVADFDNDNDLDIASSSRENDEVAWFENIDGQGTFGEKNVISDEEWRPYGLCAADLDGDNDLDILTTSEFGPSFYWHENLDGQGNFGPGIVIIQNASSWPRRTKAFDIDGDGDIDPLITESLDGKISWAENLNGQANFGPKTPINQDNFDVGWINIVDFDFDNDMDIIAVELIQGVGGNILLFTNNGSGIYSTPQILTSTDEVPNCVFPVDFDNDNDYDLVFSSNIINNFNGSISWSENLGNGIFGANNVIADIGYASTRSVYPADIDHDGDMDFVIGSWRDDKVTWLENTNPIEVNDDDETNISIYPNPTYDSITITSEQIIKEIKVYNDIGQLITSNNYRNTIDISKVASGFYFVKIVNEKNKTLIKKIIKL